MSNSRFRICAALLVLAAAGIVAGGALAVGATNGTTAQTATTVLALPAGQIPEGIACDPTGVLYVGRRQVIASAKRSDIIALTPGGDVRSVMTLEDAGSPSAQGVLGLAADPAGRLYAALASFDATRRGVWQVDPATGTGHRLENSEQIGFPNGLALDPRGNLYVTNSGLGQVWRFPPNGPGALWLQHPQLAPFDPAHPVLPPVGANGVAYAMPDSLFVANTQRGTVVRIPINHDGSAGALEIVAQHPALLTVDGIALDARGSIHAVIPGFGLLGTAPLVVVDPATGTVSATPTDPSLFGGPFSLVFGCGAWDPRRVFATNGSLVPGPAPGVVETFVGIPGGAWH